MDTESLRRTVARLDAGVSSKSSDRSSVSRPSRFPGYPEEPVHRGGRANRWSCPRCGVRRRGVEAVPWGYPPVVGEIARRSPTVVLYAHYDVQPAPPEQGWTSDPWTPGVGRALPGGERRRQEWDRDPPPTVRAWRTALQGSLSSRGWRRPPEPRTFHHLFAADVFVVADMGNLEAGPTLTTTLRGDVSCASRSRPSSNHCTRAWSGTSPRRDDGARPAAGHPARRCGRGVVEGVEPTLRVATSRNRTSERWRICWTARP